MAHTESSHIDNILDISVRAGTMILQNGGETYRCEESMLSIASSLGALESSAFVTPTVVMLSCQDGSGVSHTRITRVTERTINLGVIARINELSRRLVKQGKTSNLHQLGCLLDRIARAPVHHPFGVVLATGLSGFFFSLLFNGSPREALLSFVIGALLRTSLFAVIPLGLSGFVISAFGGLVVSLLSGLAVLVSLSPSTANISIAVLMSLVPGLAIVNSIRDIIAGDLVAGSARLLEAFIIAAGLSLGAGVGLLVYPSFGVHVAMDIAAIHPLWAFVLAFCAGASFAHFFYISKYDIVWTSILAGLGWIVYVLSSPLFIIPSGGYFAGALVVGLLAELFAVVFRKPATVYIVSGIIPLVPGGGMYETMLYSMMGNIQAAEFAAFRTLSAAAAIAVGIALASSVARVLSRMVQNLTSRTS